LSYCRMAAGYAAAAQRAEAAGVQTAAAR
jgi:hypothetical protein